MRALDAFGFRGLLCGEEQPEAIQGRSSRSLAEDREISGHGCIENLKHVRPRNRH
jgi:hypothetical protein